MDGEEMGTPAENTETDQTPEPFLYDGGTDNSMEEWREYDRTPGAVETPAPVDDAPVDNSGGEGGSAPPEDAVLFAKSQGFSDEEISALASSNALIPVLNRIADAVMAERAAFEQRNQARPQPPAQADAAPEKWVPEMDPERFDPDFMKVMESMNDHYASKLNSLNQKLASLEETKARFDEMDRQRETERQTEWFDNGINTLGGEWEQVFGKGTVRDIDRNSEQFRNRVTLIRAHNALSEAYRLQGANIPPEQVLARAARAEFGDKFHSAVTQNISTQLKDRQRQFTLRPTHRDEQPLSQREIAERNAERNYAALEAKYGNI